MADRLQHIADLLGIDEKPPRQAAEAGSPHLLMPILEELALRVIRRERGERRNTRERVKLVKPPMRGVRR